MLATIPLMADTVRLGEEAITVKLTGWDRVISGRRKVRIDRNQITSVAVAHHYPLESLIDHRVLGFGSHIGSQQPNRRRVGTMLGRAVTRKQFSAAPAGPQDEQLLVVDLDDPEFSRVVLSVADPTATATTLTTWIKPA